MFKVGITGNIGSGKTTVSKVFELLGIPVFYADEHSKLVMVQDQELIDGVKAAFGSESYFDDGTLNRKHIAEIVFNDADELAKLNALVHPATFRAFDHWLTQQGNVPYVMKEAAILFESGSYKLCDRSLLVSAPLELRIQRILKRDNITREQAEARDAKQFSEEKKKAMADDLIINDDTQLVIPQVLALHQQYLKLSK
ncbi:dephospho-CoA kinase [Mucilaginibacter myungsuensis]|uniref:Dephospho-CoA kinase n=1 Tax=Mucilaginibacter myungsuensis TaxID=649104 RepID=A0A929L1R5_9SPHI|nr:dephospho-CoA kinase [Mucilaginibacter myungsuensis]MBE9662505.1 dephospho-CoA kinase [Mucilaginibacter myungsuensis]MDN3597924.1 dephospho-CoA kinase [Mucilaginibacter myungsuensis]